LQVQKLNAEPKVEPEINSGNQEIKIEQTRVNSLPTVEVVASTPSVEIIAPSNERNSVPKENNSPPIEEIRLETIVVEPTETIPVEVKSIETKPIVNPQSEEPKGKLKLRDMNSVKTVLDEIYGLWSINLMEKLKIDPSKAHLEEPARKSMQKMIIENIINDLTDNVNLNSLEMSYNKVCSILQNRRFPMENMISKEQFCYERTD
jgi:hypothetical protein